MRAIDWRSIDWHFVNQSFADWLSLTFDLALLTTSLLCSASILVLADPDLARSLFGTIPLLLRWWVVAWNQDFALLFGFSIVPVFTGIVRTISRFIPG